MQHELVARALSRAGETVEADAEKWYEVEAYLWILLFVALLKLMDIPHKLFSQHTSPPARWAALALTLCWAVACCVSACGDLLPRKKAFTSAATTCGAVLTLSLPFLWIAVLFRACGFPVLALALTGFMCVIMYPHIRIVPRVRAALAWIPARLRKRAKF